MEIPRRADPGTNGRAIVYTRGRVIGGSSSINGLIYIRGHSEDYDHWAQLGNRVLLQLCGADLNG